MEWWRSSVRDSHLYPAQRHEDRESECGQQNEQTIIEQTGRQLVWNRRDSNTPVPVSSATIPPEASSSDGARGLPA